RLGRLVVSAPLLEGPAQFPPGESTIWILERRRFEGADRFHPDVGVVVAESLVDERLALWRGRADGILEQTEMRLDFAGGQSGQRQPGRPCRGSRLGGGRRGWRGHGGLLSNRERRAEQGEDQDRHRTAEHCHAAFLPGKGAEQLLLIVRVK